MKNGILSLLSLALVIAFLPALTNQGDPAAQALLAKHRAFVGWQFGDGTFDHGVRITGNITRQTGAKASETATISTLRLGALYRSTLHDEKTGRDSNTGFTGNIFWSSDSNGFTHPVLGDYQQFLTSEQIFLNEATTELAGTSHGSATIDGVATQIVRISPQGAVAIDLYVDPSTGAYKRVVFDPGGDNERTLNISSYLDAGNGRKIVGSYQFQYSRYTTTFTKIEPIQIDLNQLHPPEQTAQWTFANPAPFPIKVTDQRVFVDATVNGIPGRFILDTGNGVGLTFTNSFADRAHLKALEDTAAYGLGGEAKDTTTLVDTLKIGGNTLSNVIGDFQELPGFEADGLIGAQLLGGAVVSLNFDNSTLTIQPPSTDVSQIQGMHTIVDLSEGTPALPMKVDGTIALTATMDSGNPLYVVFGDDMIYKYGLRMIRGDLLAGGVGGYEVDECGHIDEIDLGPVHYQTPSACVSPSFSGHNGLVGLTFMKNFDFVFDYPQALVVMTPRNQ